MTDRILVVTKRVGFRATRELIRPTLGAMQALVGGYVELVDTAAIYSNGAKENFLVDLYCNEEGRMRGALPNFVRPGGGELIVGDAFWAARNAQGDLISMPEDLADMIIVFMGDLTPSADQEGLAS